MLEDIRDLQTDLDKLIARLKKTKTTQVSNKSIIAATKSIVDNYFRTILHSLGDREINSDLLSNISKLMHSLLGATHKKSSLETYKKISTKIKPLLVEVEKLMLSSEGKDSFSVNINDDDQAIIDTLEEICPAAALSYKQATLDMVSNDRLSWRGPATDYRESLRECLDHLAPDKVVKSAADFKLEKNATGPTMRQKVQYILKKRQQARNSIKSVQDSIMIIDGLMSTYVRSVYTRASISTHTPTEKSEVVRVRDQVRTVLRELLELG